MEAIHAPLDPAMPTREDLARGRRGWKWLGLSGFERISRNVCAFCSPLGGRAQFGFRRVRRLALRQRSWGLRGRLFGLATFSSSILVVAFDKGALVKQYVATNGDTARLETCATLESHSTSAGFGDPWVGRSTLRPYATLDGGLTPGVASTSVPRSSALLARMPAPL